MKIFHLKKGFSQTEIIIFGFKFYIRHDQEKVLAENYARKLAELRQAWGKRKIKIGFLISEEAKWKYQSFYDQIAQSDYFEPVVLVTQLLTNHKGKKNFYKTIEDCYHFFKSKGMNVCYAYDLDRKKYIPVKDFGIDILFYEQPWSIDDTQHPFVVSQNALTCYVPYGLHLVDYVGSYMPEFHQMLWKMFIENECLIKDFSKLVQKEVTNCAVVGCGKLDDYFNKGDSAVLDSGGKPIVIYAPHHSFEKDGLSCATFHKNGQDILKLAQKYQDQIYWVFKPHPRFKTALVLNGIMSEREIEAYYDQWKKLGTIYESGDYIDLFKQSSAMITDCVAFLGEYLPSSHPVLHLLSDKRPFNAFAKMFIDSFYQIEDMSQLETAFSNVVIGQKDDKKEERLSKIPLLLDPKETVASKMIAELTKYLEE